jgi:hypothetical protein
MQAPNEPMCQQYSPRQHSATDACNYRFWQRCACAVVTKNSKSIVCGCLSLAHLPTAIAPPNPSQISPPNRHPERSALLIATRVECACPGIPAIIDDEVRIDYMHSMLNAELTNVAFQSLAQHNQHHMSILARTERAC